MIFFIQRWIISTLILTLSSHWLIFIKYAGDKVGMADSTGKLTTLGFLITTVFFLSSLLFALLKTAADKYNEKAKTRGGFILQRLLESINFVTKKKMQRFLKYVDDNFSNLDIHPFGEITKPREQINSLLENIQVTLSQIFGLDRDKISVSVLYQSPESDEWEVLDSININNELDIDELINNPNTTLRQVIDRKSNSIFLPDKRVAHTRKQYVYAPLDEQFENIGSIFCSDISVGSDKKRMNAIISISTYGKQLCLETDKDAIHKIQNIIIPTFESRLRLELALFYIKEILNPQCLNCPVGGFPEECA